MNDVEKEYEATKMAIHAAMVHRMDISIGRLIDQLKAMGEYDNIKGVLLLISAGIIVLGAVYLISIWENIG